MFTREQRAPFTVPDVGAIGPQNRTLISLAFSVLVAVGQRHLRAPRQGSLNEGESWSARTRSPTKPVRITLFGKEIVGLVAISC